MKYGDHTLTPHLHRQPPTTPTHLCGCGDGTTTDGGLGSFLRLLAAGGGTLSWSAIALGKSPQLALHCPRHTTARPLLFVALLLQAMQNTCGNKQHQAVANLWQQLLLGGVAADRQLVCLQPFAPSRTTASTWWIVTNAGCGASAFLSSAVSPRCLCQAMRCQPSLSVACSCDGCSEPLDHVSRLIEGSHASMQHA
jgi:hypothetical protein